MYGHHSSMTGACFDSGKFLLPAVCTLLHCLCHVSSLLRSATTSEGVCVCVCVCVCEIEEEEEEEGEFNLTSYPALLLNLRCPTSKL